MTGADENLQLLPGWRFTRDRFEAKIFVSLDAKHGATSPDDPDNPLRGTHVGLRTAVDVWYEPTPSTMLAAAYRQLRVGAHVTALKTGLWEWSAAVGWSDDSDSRTGPYLRLGVLTRR